jgi:acetylornithine aminotransferase/acetylornithine/N-succinyldiaminopimelate aminotransferase
MDLKSIRQLDEKYFLQVYGERYPVCFVRGEDVFLYDTEGKQYLDFLAGIAVNSLGYSDKGFKAALHAQIDKLIHISNYFYVEPQAQLAGKLCKSTGYDRVFFQNSGTEAIECAIKMAKKYHYNKGEDRTHFVTLQNSFHGRTLAALSATGQEKFHTPFAPLPYSFTYVQPGDMEAIEKAVTTGTAGVFLEFVQGEGGVLPLTAGYLNKLQEVCRKAGALLVAEHRNDSGIGVLHGSVAARTQQRPDQNGRCADQQSGGKEPEKRHQWEGEAGAKRALYRSAGTPAAIVAQWEGACSGLLLSSFSADEP